MPAAGLGKEGRYSCVDGGYHLMHRLTLVASLPEVGQRDLVLPNGRDVENRSLNGSMAAELGCAGMILCGTDGSARLTAQRLGWSALPTEALRARNLGDWAGCSLPVLAEHDFDAVTRFQREMSFVPPGGESLLDVADRLKGWLKDVSTSAAGRSVAVVEPGVVRAMVAVVLAAPEAMQRLDVESLSTTVLTKSSAGWRVRSVSSRGLRG